MNQLYGVLIASLAILIQGFIFVPGDDGKDSSQRKLISMINNTHINGKAVDGNTAGRIIFINALTAFVFQLCYTIAYKRCRESKLRFVLIVSSVALCFTAALDNETVCSLNPLMCSPIMLVSFYLDFKTLVYTLIVPSVFGFLGTVAALKGFRKIMNNEDEAVDVVDNLQMIKPKRMVFEL